MCIKGLSTDTKAQALTMAKVEIRKYKKVKNYYFFCAIIRTLLPTFQKPVLVAENFQVFR